MKCLVVGGTGFLGGAIAKACLDAGDEVAVLSRRSAAEVGSAGVKVLTGDRHDDLSALRGRRFDLVFDTCGYAPDAIERLLDALEPFEGRYIFVSSASVYDDFSRPGLAEDVEVPRATPEQLRRAAIIPPNDRANAAAYGDAYGPLKRECECAAIERLGDRALILRSGLLVGAGDYTDRLTWWLRRIDAGGKIPVPGPPERPIQLIDVRDAAAFAARGARHGLTGIYNLTSRPMPMTTLLDSARRISGADAHVVWLDEKQVTSSGIAAWTDIPLWLPTASGRFLYFFDIDVDKAVADGMQCRPLDETLSDILAWDRGRRDQPLRCGLSKAQEAVLLAGAGP